MALCLFVLCGVLTDKAAVADETVAVRASTRTVTDSAGRTVALPGTIERIVVTCYGGAAHEVAVLGAAEKIVAQPSDRIFRQFLKMYPRFREIPDAGSFDNVNLERILALRPDLVVAGVVSPQGNRKIARLGIPVFVVAVGRADIPLLMKEFLTLGQMLGAEGCAAELVAAWQTKLGWIEKRLSAVPETCRKKVFYASHGSVSPLNTGGRGSWGHHFITAAGGVNVAASLGPSQEMTVEQLLVWDPDVIVVSHSRAAQDPVAAILTNPKLASIKAIRENAVYRCPVGAFWWDRPSPEAVLGILWLGRTLYPERLADIDLKQEARDFYRRFYGHALTDLEYQAFMEGQTLELKP